MRPSGLKKSQRAYECQRQPHSELKPSWRCVSHLYCEYCRHDDMTDHNNHEVGGEIVGAVLMEFFSALRTMVRNFQEAFKQMASSAVGTFPTEAAPQGRVE